MPPEEQQKKESVTSTPVVKEDQKKALSPLESFLTQNDVLLMIYPKNEDGDFYEYISSADEIKVFELLKKKKEYKKTLLIYLDTAGGNVYSAIKIMDILRAKYPNSIDVAVAQEAKSSGTIICLAADSIIMSSISELGPLDKPLFHPEKEKTVISALDIVRSLDRMIKTAIDKEIELAKSLSKEFNLSNEKALELAGRSIAELMSPMICKEDSKIYNQASRLLDIAKIYTRELLEKHRFKGVESTKLRKAISSLIADKLVWSYPDHGFAIRRVEAKENLLLAVKNAEGLDFLDNLWDNYFKQHIGKKTKLIEFL